MARLRMLATEAMPPSLTDRLAPHKHETWFPEDPFSEPQLAGAEQALGLRFPADFRDLLRAGGGEIAGENARILLFPAHHLARFNSADADGWKALQDLFVFADDAGDALYCYDPDDRLGRGAWAIFSVSKGAPRTTRAHVARDLTHLVDRILAGDDVLDSPLGSP